MPLVPDPKNCDISVKRAIQGLSKKLGYTSSPVFNNINITNVVTASSSVFSETCTVAAGLNVLRVTGLQTDATAMTGTLRGAYIDVSNGALAATGTIRAMELKARTEAPGDTGNTVAVLEGLSISADSKDHSVTTMRAAEFILDGSTGGTITEAVGLRIANNLQANKATASYGLQIYRDSFNYTYDIILSLGGHITGDSYINQDLRTTASPTFNDLTLSTPVNIYALSHNSFADYNANKHIDHTGVTLTAGTGLTGGGDISTSRTFAVDGLLEDLDTLSPSASDGQFIVATGAGTLAWESGATARTSIGLGTGDSPTFTALTLSTIAAEGTDVDKFLVDSTGVIKYRTGTQVLSDIGGQASGNYITALTGEVTASGPGSVAATITNDAVTYAKMQNVSVTDKVLGRVTAGAGDIEEIACTAAGRAILDDANATVQRATLGLVLGTNVQAWDAQLDNLATITATAAGIDSHLGGHSDTVLWSEVNKTTSSIADITTKNHTDLTAGDGSDHSFIDQSVVITSTPTFAGIVVASNGTIGQAAGPLLTFDDTNNFLEITGCTIGIGGIIAPECTVHILAPNSAAGGIRIQDSLTNATIKRFRLKTGNYTNAEEPVTLFLGSADATLNDLYMGGGSSVENAMSRIFFLTAANNTTLSGTIRMRINPDGKIAVGSHTPLTLFHQQGTSIGLSAAETVNTDTTMLIEGTDAFLELFADDAGTWGSGVLFSETSSGALTDKWSILRKTSGTGDSSLNISYGASALPWSNTMMLTMLPGGNLGVNDAAPAEKLDVNGNINTTGVLKIDDVQVVSNQEAHIIDANGTIGDITTKFNTLLSQLETHGLIAAA